MIKVPLPCLVDFMLSTGTSRVVLVKKFKKGGYGQFFRSFVETLVGMHAAQKPRSVFDEFLAAERDRRRRYAVGKFVEGHKRFLDDTSVTWFTPPSERLVLPTFAAGELELDVSPEFGFEIGGVSHAVHLYLAFEPLSVSRANALQRVTVAALGPDHPCARVGVLDARCGRLHVSKDYDRASQEEFFTLVRAEATAFASIYKAV